MTLRATVLVPAHNEAAVIARTLAPLCELARQGTIKIIVLANGCTDDTACKARQACPAAEVVEIAAAGKTTALNLGQALAVPGAPILCLDADLHLEPAALMALVAAIDAGADAAVGQMTVDFAKASAPVRAFQRAWTRNPYFAKGKFGGVFALSFATARTLFPLPEVTGDDEFLRRSLDPARVAYVPDCRFVAQSPRTLRSLVATRKRALRGARQVAALGLANPTRRSAIAMLRASMGSPGQALDLAVFLAVSSLARLSLALERRNAPSRWERDLTSRQPEVAQ